MTFDDGSPFTLHHALNIFLVIVSIAYVIYSLYRAHKYWEDGIKETLLGWKKNDLRLYHIIWIVVDIPSIFIGRIYHVIAKIFSMKLYTFKTDEPVKKNETN